jgi:CxxC motif-containing protein
MKELICIVCPKGCHLQVDEEHGYAVTGNSCPRGAEYGKAELTHPTRVVTSTVRCLGGAHPRCPVKTDRAVPKELIFQVMEEINALTVSAPVRVGQVLLEHVCGTQANIVSARDTFS